MRLRKKISQYNSLFSPNLKLNIIKVISIVDLLISKSTQAIGKKIEG